MRNSIWLSLAISAVISSVTTAAPVSKRIENQIKSKIIPAYRQNDWGTNAKVLLNWVTKFDAAQLDHIDAILDEQGVPPIGKLILDVRVAELLSGDTTTKSTPRELTRTMPVLYCLLYTSPSPRDKRQSRMPSSA